MSNTAIFRSEREFAFGEREFRFLGQLVHDHTGIVLAAHKRDMVYSRLARRLRALDLKDFASYCELLQSPEGAAEMSNLVNAITTNLTSFFREGHHFEHLREQVLKPMANKSEKHLRIWSSACSSGMEPYSIAMVMKAAIANIASWDARILATDIDTNMVEKGKAGIYPKSELENIPTTYRSMLDIDGQHLSMSPALKELIAFKYLNLLDTWPMKGQFDAVFCRNVVIYFDKPTQAKLFSRIADHIKPGGWLYIGHSENLTNICDRFELRGRTIYRRIK
ncbi:chemotaxis protein CheR [bacterium]|nr:chemotaxis protein CheR [bacterium]